MMSPFSHFWSEGARLKLVPAVIRQYSKFMPRSVSSLRSVSTTSSFVVPGGLLAMVASIASITASEAYFSNFNSAADFTRRWRSST